MEERVLVGGVDLSEWFHVVDVQRPLPQVVPDTRNVPGRDGIAFAGADVRPREISFLLVTKHDRRERFDASRLLAPVICSKEPVKVAFSSDNGLYYIAVPYGASDTSEYMQADSVRVSMMPLDAAMYGRERSILLDGDTAVSFMVDGTYPTGPLLASSNAKRDSTSGVWGVRLDGGDYVHVALANSSNHTISLDCGNCTCLVDSSVSLPTLDSDWLILEPGPHSIALDNGTGRVRVTWTERWL